MLNGSGPKMVACGPYVARQPPVCGLARKTFFFTFPFKQYAYLYFLYVCHTLVATVCPLLEMAVCRILHIQQLFPPNNSDVII